MDTAEVQEVLDQNIKLHELIMNLDSGALNIETDDLLVFNFFGRSDQQIVQLPEEDIDIEFGNDCCMLFRVDEDKHILVVNKHFDHAEMTARIALSYLDFKNECMGDPPDPTYE